MTSQPCLLILPLAGFDGFEVGGEELVETLVAVGVAGVWGHGPRTSSSRIKFSLPKLEA